MGVGGDDAEAFLVFEDAFTKPFVAVVKEVHGVDFLHPFFGRVVRRVRSTRGIIAEEGLARVDLVDLVHPVDGVVGHGGDQVPGTRRFAAEGIDLRGVAEEIRLPLVGVAADEAVKVVEAHADRPLVERPDLAGTVDGSVVLLAEPGRGVAIFLENTADGGLVLGNDAVIAREAGGLFGDDAEAAGVVIAAGDESGPRRRAEGRGVNVVVAQAVLGDAVHRWRRNHTAKRTGHAEARVVCNNEQDVGSLLGRHDAWRPPGFGLLSGFLDHAAKIRVGWRQLFAVDGGLC